MHGRPLRSRTPGVQGNHRGRGAPALDAGSDFGCRWFAERPQKAEITK